MHRQVLSPGLEQLLQLKVKVGCSCLGPVLYLAIYPILQLWWQAVFSVVLWSLMSSIGVIIFRQLKLIWTFHSIDSIIRVTLIFGNQISQPVAKVKRVSQPVISKSQSTQSNQLKIRVETNQSIQSTWLVYNPGQTSLIEMPQICNFITRPAPQLPLAQPQLPASWFWLSRTRKKPAILKTCFCKKKIQLGQC